jgi:hypothetical protein
MGKSAILMFFLTFSTPKTVPNGSLISWYKGILLASGMMDSIRCFPTLWLADEDIHEQEEDQLPLRTHNREEATSHLVEPVECSEETLYSIGGSGYPLAAY